MNKYSNFRILLGIWGNRAVVALQLMVGLFFISDWWHERTFTAPLLFFALCGLVPWIGSSITASQWWVRLREDKELFRNRERG